MQKELIISFKRPSVNELSELEIIYKALQRFTAHEAKIQETLTGKINNGKGNLEKLHNKLSISIREHKYAKDLLGEIALSVDIARNEADMARAWQEFGGKK